MRRFLWTGWLAVVAVAALTLQACFFSNKSTMRLDVQAVMSLDSADLMLVLSDPNRTRVFDDASFERSQEGRVLRSKRFRVANSGVVSLELTYTSDDGTTVAAGQASWNLIDDFNWTVLLTRGVANPTDTCFGCIGSAGFDLAPAARREPGERVWVIWAGVRNGFDGIL